MHGVSQQEAASGLAVEEFVSHHAGGEGGESCEAQRLGYAQGVDEASRGDDGWKRSEQRVHEGLANALPLLEESQPGAAVPRVVFRQPRGGDLDIVVDDRSVGVLR